MVEYYVKFQNSISETFRDPTEAIHEANHDSRRRVISYHIAGSGITSENINFFTRSPIPYPVVVERTIFEGIFELTDTIPVNISFVRCQFEHLVITGTYRKEVHSILFDDCRIGECYISNFENLKIEFINSKDIGVISISGILNISSIQTKNIKLRVLKLIGSPNSRNVIDVLHINNTTIDELISLDYVIVVKTEVSHSNILKYSISSSELHLFEIQQCNNEELATVEISSSTFHNYFRLYCINGFEFKFNQVKVSAVFKFELLNSNRSSFELNQCYFGNEVTFFDPIKIEDCISLKIIETVFKELVVFNKNQPHKLVIINSLFQNGVLLPINEIVTNPDRENLHNGIHSSVWCILKNQAIARNDRINALVYRKFEMNAYSHELSNQENRSTEEQIVLWLNKVSNNHGLSWGQGILFTMISWLGFYFLYSLSATNLCLCGTVKMMTTEYSFWSDAITFLWLPQGLQSLTNNITISYNAFSAIVMVVTFVLGKIAIAYGIYQTISAFRKHGKI